MRRRLSGRPRQLQMDDAFLGIASRSSTAMISSSVTGEVKTRPPLRWAVMA